MIVIGGPSILTIYVKILQDCIIESIQNRFKRTGCIMILISFDGRVGRDVREEWNGGQPRIFCPLQRGHLL